ncbi:MAG: MFS transporter [Steroidobacteraceae bacterium]
MTAAVATEARSASELPEAPQAGAYSWYVVAILLLAYIVSFVDRQSLTLMVEPLKRDLGLSDTQVSLLHGMAFALFYTFLGLPIGRLVDAFDRRRIVIVGVALWSVMTAGCGLARNFGSMFLFRMGVGVGEAALSPAAYSMIADYFPRHSRGRALAVYTLGIPIGIGVALMVGGAIVGYFNTTGGASIALLGHLRGWQVAFLIIGLPGLLVALLMCTVREPPRRECLGPLGAAGAVPLRQVVRFVAERRQALGSMFLGFSLVILVNYAVLAWVPTLFIRIHGWNIARIGFWFGLINAVFGTLGGYAGGWLADLAAARGHRDAPVRVVLFGSLCALPFAVLAPLVSSAPLSLLLFAVATFFLFIQGGVAPGAVQSIVPNQMRGQLSALQLFVQNLVGLGLGATSVALLTDYVFADSRKLGYSMAIVILVVLPLSALSLWYCLGRYRICAERAREWAGR